jgi:DNA-binding XRE family transcriptional regulator
MNALEIKENRKRLGLTQDALGKLLGVSKRTIINYESGDVVPVTKSELLHQILLADKLELNNDKKEENDPYIDALTDKLFSSDKFKQKLKEEQKQISTEELIAIVLKYLKEVD